MKHIIRFNEELVSPYEGMTPEEFIDNIANHLGLTREETMAKLDEFTKQLKELNPDYFYVVYDGKSAYIVSKSEYTAIAKYVNLLGKFDTKSEAEKVADKKNKEIKSGRSVWHPIL